MKPNDLVSNLKQEIRDAEQVLCRVLCYPKYADDQVNFPEATDADGYCSGDSTIVSLAMEAAELITRLQIAMLSSDQ